MFLKFFLFFFVLLLPLNNALSAKRETQSEKIEKLSLELSAVIDGTFDIPENENRWALQYHQLKWENNPEIHRKIQALLEIKNNISVDTILFGLIHNSPRKFSSKRIFNYMLRSLASNTFNLNTNRAGPNRLKDPEIRKTFLDFVEKNAPSAIAPANLYELIHDSEVFTVEEIKVLEKVTLNLLEQKSDNPDKHILILKMLKLYSNSQQKINSKILLDAIDYIANNTSSSSNDILAELIKIDFSLYPNSISKITTKLKKSKHTSSQEFTENLIKALGGTDLSKHPNLLAALRELAIAKNNKNSKLAAKLLANTPLNQQSPIYEQFKHDLKSADWEVAQTAAYILRGKIDDHDKDTIRELEVLAANPNDAAANEALLTLRHLSQTSKDAQNSISRLKNHKITPVKLRCLSLLKTRFPI